MIMKPNLKPTNACFSSGPCAKRPGWSYDNLPTDILGRSHRAELSKKLMKEIVDKSRSILGIPADWKIGITPASDTGAIELAMWNLMGAPGIGVDVFAWEAFSKMWLEDITTELRLPDVKTHVAEFGDLPDFSRMAPDRDAIFVWNGTTSGVCIPDNETIKAGNKGLRFCDAISAIFGYDLPWEKLDVVTWSWQKLMGGEAAHGMIALSPKAIKRLEDYTPTWPLPKIFKLKPNGQIDWPFFEGVFINTPSMICIAEAVDSLNWIESIGGLKAMTRRMNDNAAALDQWVQKTPWIDYLANNPAMRSKTSVCLKIVAPEFLAKAPKDQKALVDHMVNLLEQEDAAYDCKSYKTAPVGLRFWCGGTVETSNIKAMTPWLDWAYAQAMAI
jgi:phosphoserine aminotransferase